MSFCFRRFPGPGPEFHAHDPGNSQYGGERKPVPCNRRYTAPDQYGRQLVFIYLPGYWDHIKCGEKCGTRRGRRNGRKIRKFGDLKIRMMKRMVVINKPLQIG